MTRRSIVLSSLAAVAARGAARPKAVITGLELLPVRATERTVWLFIRLRTDAGVIGLGEASDAFGFSNTTRQDGQRMETLLRQFFELVRGRSPLDIKAYRQAGLTAARAGGLGSATAYSAIEQALWDLSGQLLGVPVHDLLGGPVRESLPVYANINRATRQRNPAGFAATARQAVAEGFRAVKAAPFDGFPKLSAPESEIRVAADLGVNCVAAIREAVGPDIEVMIDCHSFFDVQLARSVAERLERYNLGWYEEPVSPQKIDETVQIRRSIRQKMAAGEILFGVAGFTPLCRTKAVEVIMPDVKHCGGVLEMTHIAAMADAEGVAVAPHNPSGPVATAAGVQVCAGMKNFRILEFQWGEVDWRSDITIPPEKFDRGSIAVRHEPGFGIRLNDKTVQAHPL